MHKYLVKRIIMMLPTLFGAGIFIFFLLRLIPGDICLVRLGGQGGFVDEAAIIACRQQLGLDQPLILQFITWFVNFFTFDFGISMWTSQPIIEEVGLRFELSLQIALMATFISIIIAVPMGIASAVKQNLVSHLARRHRHTLTHTVAGSYWSHTALHFETKQRRPLISHTHTQ